MFGLFRLLERMSKQKSGSKKMPTLSEYEAQFSAKRKREREILPRGDKFIGLACDNCGHELAAERGLLASSPPQQNIYCPNCNWTGRRFVE